MSVEVVFGALGDRSRFQMVSLLGEKDCTVQELRSSLGISQSSTSQHLKVLHQAGLVAFTKHGNFRIYSLRRNKLKKAMHFFDNLWDDGLVKLKSTLEGNNG